MSELNCLTMAQARDGLAKGDFTSVELTQAHIAALEASRELNAFVTETPEQALEAAKASDARRVSSNSGGGEAGSMEGLPIAIKDLFCTEGVLTTASSHILDGFTPQYENLQKLHEKLSGKSFSILAFPCNDFSNQEPGTERKIFTATLCILIPILI